MKQLLDKEDLHNIVSDDSEAVIVINHTGHGSTSDLETLKDDLKANGFRVTVYGDE